MKRSISKRRGSLFTLLAVILTELACPTLAPAEGDRVAEREAMVSRQIVARGVKDPRVLRAMRKVRRHLFVPASQRTKAYEDHPLPIGENQTISQPYIVAFMTEALELTPAFKVLEIGTGSGYQAAVLAELAKSVYTIEIIPSLARSAAKLLKELGYKNIHVREGDGYGGWPEEAPFDSIMLTAAPPRVPKPLLDQLKVGGTLVAPIGEPGDQKLERYVRTKKGYEREELIPVRFVPMTGKSSR